MQDIKYYYQDYSDTIFEIDWCIDSYWVDKFSEYDHENYPTFDTLEECQNHRSQILQYSIDKLEKRKSDLSYMNALGQRIIKAQS